MDAVDKKLLECLELTQASNRLASKASLVFSMVGLIQEAVQLNQAMSKKMTELVEAVKNERAQKGPNADGGEVSGEARKTAP